MKHSSKKLKLLSGTTIIRPLKRILMVGSIGSFIALVNEVVSGQYLSSFFVGIIFVGFLLSLILYKRTFYFASAVTVLIICMISANSLMFIGNGIHDISILLYPTTIVFACVVLSKKVFWQFIGFSLFCLNVISLLGTVGYLQVEFISRHTFNEIININLILLAFSFLVRYLFNSISDSNMRLLEANATLQDSEARFRSIVENSPSILLYFNGAGEILYSNLHIKFPDSKKIISLYEILLPDQKESVQQIVRHVQNGMTEETQEIFWNFSSSLADHTYSTIIAKIKNDAQQNYIALITDITENKQLQDQLFHIQKMEILGTLAGSIAHDFNNTINVVSLHADRALRRKEIDKESEKDFRFIRETVVKAAGLTQKILTFSNRTETPSTQININDVIADVEKLLRKAVDKNIEIEYHLSESLALINGHSTELEQILMNLVINARDAIRDKGFKNQQKKIIIETKNSNYDELGASPLRNGHHGPCVVLSVRDNGCGIPEELQQKIFQPFFSTKGKERGTGLGLSTIRNIVQHHNATVHLESTMGEGTDFSIAFPATGNDFKILSQENKPDMNVRLKTIALIDDNPDTLTIIRKSLEKSGFKVAAFQSESAFEEWRSSKENPFDLLITDFYLIENDGRSVIEKIREKYPSMPIILMSGYPLDNLDIELAKYQPIEFIQKPLTSRQIIPRIQTMLS
ncbi:MAG: response regulator [Bacteroidetes bacterium]|nr:response regulator [Bacteroidota bacterium]